MTLGTWCILAAAVLPYVFVGLSGLPFAAGRARWGKGYDNENPRDYLEGLTGWRRRARSAEANGYEAFPPFAAGVLVAQTAGASPGTVGAIAASFVALRLIHGVLFIADLRTPRSVVWFGGVACVIALFVVASMATGAR